MYVAVNNTRSRDEHLFGQVSTRTARTQLRLFCCTKSAHHKDTLAQVLGSQVEPDFLDDFMSYNSLTTKLLIFFQLAENWEFRTLL